MYEYVRDYLEKYPVFANLWSIVGAPVIGLFTAWVTNLKNRLSRAKEELAKKSAELVRVEDIVTNLQSKNNTLESKLDIILANQSIQSMGMKIPTDAKEKIVANSKSALSTLKDKVSLEKIAEQAKEIIPEQLKDEALKKVEEAKGEVKDRLDALANREV